MIVLYAQFSCHYTIDIQEEEEGEEEEERRTSDFYQIICEDNIIDVAEIKTTNFSGIENLQVRAKEQYISFVISG